MRSCPSLPWRLPFVLLAACFSLAGTARAQSDEDAEDDESEQEVRYVLPASAFDSWVFQHGQTVDSVRAQLEAHLELAVDEVDRAGALSHVQRRKLQLAGQGDIARYFEEVEVLRRKFLVLRGEAAEGRESLTEVWKLVEPLRLKLAAGLFREGSLFRKSWRRTLSPEHAARCEGQARERRALGYRARIEWVVAMLDNAMPMREEQRQGLVRFLLAETRPPRRSGEYDHYVILWQMYQMPEDRLKPLFDEGQWKMVNHQLDQLKGVREHLERNGWLALEGDPAPGEPDAPAAKATEAKSPEARAEKP